MNSASFYTVPTSQGSIAVWDSGGMGPPVVFLHGNSACKEIWKKQFTKPLTEQYRFFALDFPGHGKSEPPVDKQKTYSYDGYAAVVREVMVLKKIDCPIVVAWSLGVHIAFALHSQQVPLAGILITGGSPVTLTKDGKVDMLRAFHPHPNPRRAVLLVKGQLDLAEARDLVATSGFNPDEAPFMLEAAFATDVIARPMIIKNRDEGRGCGDYKTLVETVTTPICIVEGKNDPIIKFSYLEQIVFKNLFRRTIFMIPNAGHAAFWDQPDVFNGILAQFLTHVTKKKLRQVEPRDESVPMARL